MNDTTVLRQSSRSPLPEKALKNFVWRGERYSYRGDAAGQNPPCLFYTPSRDGKFYLSVEASLPKLLYGHNLIVLTDAEIARALQKLSRVATEQFQTDFNALTASVARVDFCANFDVGADRIYAYLKAATGASPAHLKLRVIGKIETVEFFNDQRKIYLYDKRKQSAILLKAGKISAQAAAASEGVLRLESRFRNPVAVERLVVAKLNLPNRTAQTVLSSIVAKKVLSDALASFELDKPVATVDHRIEKIRNYYGFGMRLQQLLGFLQLCDYYGQANLVSLGIIKRSSYYECIKQLRLANALIYTTYHSSLPALSLTGKDTTHLSAAAD